MAPKFKVTALTMLGLAPPTGIVEFEFDNFINEILEAGERLTPYSLDRGNNDFEEYIRSLDNESRGIALPDNWVPASTFFLTDDRGRIYGAANIRHRLTDSLKTYGGHIGYGVRPGARGQGIGSLTLALALEEARKLNLTKVLLTCEKKNIHSARIIQKHGGKLESEGFVSGMTVQRYWVNL